MFSFTHELLPVHRRAAHGPVAADVIIMTGGLSEALDNGDVRQAKSFLAKAKGSLDEVIGVARGGGLR